MQLVVLADDIQKEELIQKKTNADVEIIFINESLQVENYIAADAFLILNKKINSEQSKSFTHKPVIINSTVKTLRQLKLPENFIRINGWNTFLKRDKWEVASANDKNVHALFTKLGWEYTITADEPGLISARIISMIINEAYFALGENVSTKNEIDVAMKLGTNYPWGPFEWSEKVGLKNVYHLLEVLSKSDNQYTIAPALKNEILH